jgi:HlyD family secretion protein
MQVTAPAAGRLRDVKVAIGALVRAGDVIAEIDRDDLRDAICAAEADVARLVQEDADLTRFDDTEGTSRLVALSKVEEAFRHSLDLDLLRLDSYRKIALADRSLNARHMLGNSETLKSQVEADSVESAIGATRARLHELGFTRLEDQITRRREKLKRTLSIRNAEQKLELLRAQLSRESRIISPYTGRIVDLMLTPYAPVEKGAPSVLLHPRTQTTPALEAIVFAPAGRGKAIRAGDAVEISPDTTRRHEHGFIRAIVESVSEIPATEQAMLAELKHKALVTTFLNLHREKVLLSIHVRLPERKTTTGPDGQTPVNRLDWSSASGAKQRVSAGTLCGASVVIEKRPMIALAVPWLKQMTGTD